VCCFSSQTGWPELAPGIASWLVQVVRFIILLAQAVPISLYVSLETVKVAQCKVRQLHTRCVACVFGPRALFCCCLSACRPLPQCKQSMPIRLWDVSCLLKQLPSASATEPVHGFPWLDQSSLHTSVA
jgi:hypothetical protein